MNYPYLGKKTYNGNEYVVMFTERNYGVVVMSEVEGNKNIRMGKIGDFDEDAFEPLESGKCVRLSN